MDFSKMAISRDSGPVRRRAYKRFKAEINGFLLIRVSSLNSCQISWFKTKLMTKIEKNQQKNLMTKIEAEPRFLLIFCDLSRFFSLHFAKNQDIQVFLHALSIRDTYFSMKNSKSSLNSEKNRTDGHFPFSNRLSNPTQHQERVAVITPTQI